MKVILSFLSKSCQPSRYSNTQSLKLSRCFCTSSNSGDINGDQSKKSDPHFQKLLKNSALGTGPHDETSEEDMWITSPYPKGAYTNFQQSQALKSLRPPNINPRDTSIILFPGLGSQYVGMGRELLKYPTAIDIFEAASEILEYDILKLMLHGPKEKLDKIQYSQPAVVVCSLAALEKLKEERPSAIENCVATAGFSVGEISALTFAGVFKFGDGKMIIKLFSILA